MCQNKLRNSLAEIQILHTLSSLFFLSLSQVQGCLTFHWPFINEKQSMFTFTLAFFTGYQYFCLHFRPLSAFCEKRKKEFGRKHSQWKPLTTTTTGVRLRVLNWLLCLLCSILFLFSKRKCILKSGRKLMNDKPEDFSKIFPDFSLNLKRFCFSLTFLWPWQPWNKR